MSFFFYMGKKMIDSNLLESRFINNKYIVFDVAYEDDNFIVCFNGDVYSSNINSVKDLCAMYEANSNNFLKLLDADFSLVLYDKKKDLLFGAVDKFGLKALYYNKNDDYVAFSDRILSFYKYLPIKKEPNSKKNLLYVGSHYRHIDAIEHETFYKDIFAIKHHCCMKLSNNGCEVQSYWDLELIDLSKKTKEELKKEYLSILRESVKRRLAKSKKPAFMVSSGMDSSGVAALASEILGEKVTFFTTVFSEDTEYNEADDIEPLAEKIAKEWHKLSIDSNGIVETILEVLKEADEPFYTVTQLMHYYLSKEVSKLGFDTLFGGLGGDEANCGEIEEYLFYFADLKSRGKEGKLKSDIEGWAQYHGTPIYPKSYEIAHDYFSKYINFEKAGENIFDFERYHRYMNVFNTNFYKANFVMPKLAHPYSSYLRNKLYQDLFSEAIPCVLKAEAFNLSKFNLSARMPYFNEEVMQYGFSIPIEYKYKNGCNKALLREAMKGVLPDETLDNCIKKGWNAPFGDWIKAFLSETVKTIIHNPSERQQEIYNLQKIDQLLTEHLSGNANHMMFFWQFLNYELWYGIHFGS